MAVNYPETLDSFINPDSNSSVANPSHAQQHSDANDAIEALQQKVGVDGSTVTTSLDYRVSALESNPIDEESIQQIVGDLFTTGIHNNIAVVYDDDNDRINLTGTYGDEEAIDAIATALTAGTGITKTYTETPPNYIGEYDNGADYFPGDIVSTGLQSQYWIRINEPNPGYPPFPGSPYWTAYSFSKTITIAVNTNSIATQSYVNTAISNLVDAAPGLLDTLNEIAAAIGDDANFASTVNTAIASAITTANEYTDEAVASLGNSLPTTYIPLSYYGNEEGVATLDENGFVPQTQLDIDARIQDTAAAIITNGTHTNITVNYDSVAKELSLTSTGGTSADISSAAPTNPNVGDLWLDSDTAILYIYDGAFWVEISGSGGGGGGGTGGGFTASPTAPAAPVEGSAWFDTVNAKLYVYYDSYWVEAVSPGPTGPEGPAFVNYQGNYNSGVSYTLHDGVTYQGSLWRLNENNSPAGTVPSTPNWQKVIHKGDKGDTGEITVGTVTTVIHGNPATVTNVGTSTDAILNFQIPGGPRSTIEIGDVETVTYGTPATVTNVGTETDAIFDFEIPGGPRSTIQIGNVTTGSYLSDVTVTNVGTTTDAIFNISIPQGIPGEMHDFNVRETPPPNPVEGLVWYNTSNGRAYVYYDDVWVEYAPGFVGERGPMFLNYQGAWDNTEEYVELDGVTYNGSLWVLENQTSVIGTPPASPAWSLVVEKGATGEISVGTVSNLVYGQNATVTNVGTSTDAVFNFGIPAGPRSTIEIGDVSVVTFGTPATVTNVGTESDAIFDFEIPAGPRSTLEVGTVTTGSYSSSATVTNVGTTSDAIFNFSIPQGIPGDFQPGENPPANPLSGQVWYNTAAGRAYVYHDGFWIEFSPGFVGPAGPSGIPTPEAVNSNITMEHNHSYFVNTSVARTLTLPETPSLGDSITIYDAHGLAATNNITISRNGNKINGQTEDAIIDVDQSVASFVYTGTTLGWRFI